MAHFGIVDGKETVGDIGYLLESLALATHLEEIFVVNKEIVKIRFIFETAN